MHEYGDYPLLKFYEICAVAQLHMQAISGVYYYYDQFC